MAIEPEASHSPWPIANLADCASRLNPPTEFGLKYQRPSLQWVNNFESQISDPIWETDFTLGELSAKLTPSVEVDILIYGQFGIETSLPVDIGISIESTTDATYGGSPERPVLKGILPVEARIEIKPELEKQGVLGWLLGNSFFKSIGLEEEPSIWLSATLWEKEWLLFPNDVEFVILQQPVGGTAFTGQNFTLSAGVTLPYDSRTGHPSDSVLAKVSPLR